MAPIKRKTKSKKKPEWSKLITGLVVLAGFVIVQECFVLMYICVRDGYSATAAWLTAAVGLAEVVIGTGFAGYMSLCKSDHKEGGITFEAAKAKGFAADTNKESPSI